MSDTHMHQFTIVLNNYLTNSLATKQVKDISCY